MVDEFNYLNEYVAGRNESSKGTKETTQEVNSEDQSNGSVTLAETTTLEKMEQNS